MSDTDPNDVVKLPSARVPLALDERLRNAVDALSGPPVRLSTLQALQLQALYAEVERLEREHNRGRPFAPRPAARLTLAQLRRAAVERDAQD